MINKLKQKKFVFIWGGLLSLLLVIALMPGVFASHDPEKADLSAKLLPSSKMFLLGTDHMGRCILCRLIYGVRSSLFVAGPVVFLTVLAGTMVGMFGGGMRNLIFVLSAFGWMRYARVVRSEILVLRDRAFIQAAKGMGMGDLYIMWKHVFPNIIGSVLVIMTMGAGGTILSVSGLSFLGIGVQPPTPEWGYMLNEAKMYLTKRSQLMVYPGLAIMFTIVIFNFFWADCPKTCKM